MKKKKALKELNIIANELLGIKKKQNYIFCPKCKVKFLEQIRYNKHLKISKNWEKSPCEMYQENLPK